jgi:hypothetical protein
MIARVCVSAGKRRYLFLTFRDALRSGTCSSESGFRRQGWRAGFTLQRRQLILGRLMTTSWQSSAHHVQSMALVCSLNEDLLLRSNGLYRRLTLLRLTALPERHEKNMRT